MKIAFLGTAHPFRGGLAAFNERLAKAYQKKGEEVKIFTFTTQYPQFLFPGKSQFSDSPAPDGLAIERTLSSINPFTWFKTARRINQFKPDVVITRFWLPFMGPALGTVLRRLHKDIKIVCIVDNLIPHEKRIGDRLFTRYFLPPIQGFICMSEAVRDDFQQFKTKAPVLYSPHPLYDYGALMTKEEARGKLNLNPSDRIILFFGIIRDYKGLDWLLEAFAQTKYKEYGCKLLIAGEFYTDDTPYKEKIKQLQLTESVLLHDRFIADAEVGWYFNSANLVVQPYKHATQSGVAQIAYHFEKPMIVTNVGGLGEIVPNGKAGYVVEPTIEAIAKGIDKFFENNKEEEFIVGVQQEKSKYSWDIFLDEMAKLYS